VPASNRPAVVTFHREHVESFVSDTVSLRIVHVFALSSLRHWWKTRLVAEKRFRRLDASELLAEVAEGLATRSDTSATSKRAITEVGTGATSLPSTSELCYRR